MRIVPMSIALALLVGACNTTNRVGGDGTTLKDDASAQDPDNLALADGAGLHGQAVFGQDPVYMYHLPMWDPPHNWTVATEIDLGDAKAAYAADIASSGSKLYTLKPTQGLATLSLLTPGHPFKADLYRGHYEQPAHTLIASGITVTVVATPVVHQLPDSRPHTGGVFKVFGQGNAWYAVHYAFQSPDYDQVLAIKPVDGITSDQLSAGFKVTLPDQAAPADPAARLQAGATLNGQLDSGAAFPFVVTDEAYFSVADLGQQ